MYNRACGKNERPAKGSAIAEELRRQIIDGSLKPGSKLPTYEELERLFPASRMTLNRALTALKDDGFLVGVERMGVFVSERLPHLDRLALLLGEQPERSRFNACLAAEAAAFTKETGREMEVFSGLNLLNFRKEEANRLKAGIQARRLAGMIVVFDPEGCQDQELFDGELPKIYLSPGRRTDGLKLSMGSERFVRRALERLASLSSRRVAALAFPYDNPSLGVFERLYGDYGVESRPEWRVSMDNPGNAEQIVRLLLAAPPERRPDGLLLLDDHLAEPAARGVVAEGVKTPESLTVLSHCNWRMPPARPFAMELLGYDSAQLLKSAVSAIDALNDGKAPSEPLLIDPVFESELPRKAGPGNFPNGGGIA